MSAPTLNEELQRWLQQLQDPAPPRRIEAAANLASLGSTAQPALTALCAALRDSEPVVRKMAAEALSQLGADADGLVPAVAEPTTATFPEMPPVERGTLASPLICD